MLHKMANTDYFVAAKPFTISLLQNVHMIAFAADAYMPRKHQDEAQPAAASCCKHSILYRRL